MNKENAIKIASKLLKISIEEATEYCHTIDELDALYFSVPIKGGGSLIVDKNNEVLYANSSISYKDHINAYKEGIRTPQEAFDL